MNSDVAIIQCDSYKDEEVLAALRKAMDLCPPPDVKGKKVLLKPNILRDSLPETAITTHPVLVRAAVLLFRELGAEIFVGDSSGVGTMDNKKDISGIRYAAESAGATWVDFLKEKTTINVPKGKKIRKFTVSGVFNQVDLIVSLPKMKTHTLMYYTGAMKNLFGLVPGTLKPSFHARFPGRESFARVMIDLNVAIQADYALMDGIIGLEGAGPGKAGKPKRIGIVMASSNLLAMDITASSIMGYDPLALPMNRDALERGIWLHSPKEIVIKGAPIEAVRPETFDTIPVPSGGKRGNIFDYIFTSLSMTYRSKRRPIPEFNGDICIRCGECIDICPADALSFSGTGRLKHIEILSRRCVRCYCCHEICPVGAITVADRPSQ